MTVYVLEVGEYAQRGIASVHHTLAGAQAALTYPGVTWIAHRVPGRVWWQAVDYPDGAEIEAHDVEP